MSCDDELMELPLCELVLAWWKERPTDDGKPRKQRKAEAPSHASLFVSIWFTICSCSVYIFSFHRFDMISSLLSSHLDQVTPSASSVSDLPSRPRQFTNALPSYAPRHYNSDQRYGTTQTCPLIDRSSSRAIKSVDPTKILCVTTTARRTRS